MLIVCWCSCSSAEMILPSAVVQIQESAFEGDTTLSSVILPEGIISVGDNAFSGCTGLRAVTLPATLQSIGTEAFHDCAEALYFSCVPGSAARNWVVANGFDYTAETKCRALLIGQTYTGTNRVLQGPANDMHTMQFFLSSLHTNEYSVTYKSNLTVDDMLYWISRSFGAAGEDDISLFYYSGHGGTDGSLIGYDHSDDGMLTGASISPTQLRAALDVIPGRKVIIVDACYSGAIINLAETEGNLDFLLSGTKKSGTNPATQFTSAFMSAFDSGSTDLRKRSDASLPGNRYYVMTACQATEESHEAYVTSGASRRYMGLFTYALCLGLGYDGVLYGTTSTAADINGDEVVTFAEAYTFALTEAGILAQQIDVSQTAMVYPSNCTEFSPFRK